MNDVVLSNGLCTFLPNHLLYNVEVDDVECNNYFFMPVYFCDFSHLQGPKNIHCHS